MPAKTLPDGMSFPFDFGFVPSTLGGKSFRAGGRPDRGRAAQIQAAPDLAHLDLNHQ
jgi:hypothetical protein